MGHGDPGQGAKAEAEPRLSYNISCGNEISRKIKQNKK